SRAALEVSHYLVEPGTEELEANKLLQAFEQVSNELSALKTTLPKDAPQEMAAFLDVHQMILSDPTLAQKPLELIRQKRLNAAWALTTELNDLLEQFSEIEDPYLKERGNDIRQVAERVIKAIHSQNRQTVIGGEGLISGDFDDGTIVVAHDIAPHDMLRFKENDLSGFVTDLGGKTSHTAIVARSLEIPALVGIRHASDIIEHGDWLIIDGNAGIVIVAPDEALLSEYRTLQSEQYRKTQKLQELKYSPTKTKDGVDIELFANIELPEDTRHAIELGSVGIGLFRSEFLFMNQQYGLPDEEKQYQEYTRAVEAMFGLPVNIRTIDIGSDKSVSGAETGSTGTSPLGLRAIRWSLSEPEIFLTQLRAILRASAHGKVRLLLPMLAHAQEIYESLRLIDKAKQQLRERGQAFNPNIEVGAMIEVPAAALMMPLFVKHFDYLSIGTNDLIQYTLAIDRADHAVAHLYDPLNPAVLNLIASVIRQAQKANVPIAVCGEMAGDPALTKLLLAMGLTDFSMHFSQLLLVKREILQADTRKLKKHIDELLASFDPVEQSEILNRLDSIH
ncbi:MAG: phosphoenolpyruvate--protein phosphotransferase, partial [Burkholderiaceae bacterium]|nr:phosphoenolpyruvate--protein phosphotransferase [Burkholderiaceae bacterium]